jgi:hypothetical protein
MRGFKNYRSLEQQFLKEEKYNLIIGFARIKTYACPAEKSI